MKVTRLILSSLFAVGSFCLSSCGCCTGEDPVPPLRPLPPLTTLEVEQQIYYEK